MWVPRLPTHLPRLTGYELAAHDCSSLIGLYCCSMCSAGNGKSSIFYFTFRSILSEVASERSESNPAVLIVNRVNN